MEDYAARVTALHDEMTECFADVAHEAVKVVVSVAIEVLEDAFIVETEGATDIPLADSLGLERSHSDDDIIVLLLRLELPQDAAGFSENGGFDVGQMELKGVLAEVFVIDGLGGYPALK